MRHLIKISKCSYLIFFVLILVMPGCGKKGEAVDRKDVIAYVNKEPILRSELKREIALRARQDPSFKFTPDTEADQLDMMINKKLIIQAAIDRGVAREDRFVNTIKAFWEQTLIRDFIETKKMEFKNYFYATDEELKKYYDNLSENITFKILRSKSRKYIDEAYAEFQKNPATEIIPWQVIGPVGYEDLGSSALLEAFHLQSGETKKVDDPPDHYLILVANREKKELEPFEKIKPDIEKRVIDMKEKRLFEDWLKDEKKKANIKIIEK